MVSFYATEEQITKPYSQILVPLPPWLAALGRATLVLHFAAVDAAGHRAAVTRTVSLN